MQHSSIRILIVDDNIPFLDSIERYFLSLPSENIEVCGRASSGEEAVAAANRLQPDLVILDLAMPGMSGLEVARLMKHLEFPPKIIMLTAYGHEEYRKASTNAGADGFIAKTEILSNLLPTLRTILPSAPPS